MNSDRRLSQRHRATGVPRDRRALAGLVAAVLGLVPLRISVMATVTTFVAPHWGPRVEPSSSPLATSVLIVSATVAALLGLVAIVALFGQYLAHLLNGATVRRRLATLGSWLALGHMLAFGSVLATAPLALEYAVDLWWFLALGLSLGQLLLARFAREQRSASVADNA
ncbi:hypothetical protein Pla163_13040 [Planctomycetes bacterium Pla163]|uniref:Uncharacterized protein n=1 Tax=Rohdeia mirabilis TaxID=2528008 RepID=A0A518CY99_9BACT|nr:hypothetical protein Pla163_13040 [Planctomycetes bacterium Pla163]